MKFLKSMLPVFVLLLPVFVLLLASQSFAEMNFISGVKHNVTEYSYTSDTRRIAEIDVLSDGAQEISFDITAIVSGLGGLRSDVVCRYSHRGERCDPTHQRRTLS
ncbi:hypothetical protein ACJJI4_16555 [Microbulbifer sp. TRSA002]|uniref:hypothetical protein n=1 Tax=Microbulbifer sp. TRSA002 TaxID=3243382 RepID=UPI0040397707